jgi:hypothetical protein
LEVLRQARIISRWGNGNIIAPIIAGLADKTPFLKSWQAKFRKIFSASGFWLRFRRAVAVCSVLSFKMLRGRPMDLLGFGESERPNIALSAADHVRVLAELLRAKCGGERAAIMASGLGAGFVTAGRAAA